MNLEGGQDQKRREQDVSEGPFDQRTNGFYGKHEMRFMLKERHEKEMNKNVGMNRETGPLPTSDNFSWLEESRLNIYDTLNDLEN